MQCSASRTHAVRTGQTHLPIKFHGENTPALPVTRKGKVDDFYAARSELILPLPWPTFAPPVSQDR